MDRGRPRHRTTPRLLQDPQGLRQASVGDRPRAVRRRGDRRRVRRVTGAGCRRGPVRVGRDRAVAVGHRCRGGARRRGPGAVPRPRRQRGRRRITRCSTRHRGRLRHRGAWPLCQPADRGRSDRAARLRGGAGRRRADHRLAVEPVPALCQGPDRCQLEVVTRRHPRHHAPGRWRLRRQGRNAARIRRGRGCRQAARPGGDLGSDSHRGHAGDGPQPGSGPVRRTRLHERRHVHRSAGAPGRRRWRLPRHRRRPAGRDAPHVARHVQLPGDRLRRRRGNHQHPADRRLSGRRPPRGHGPARAVGRPGVARVGYRPDRVAHEEPAGRHRVPVHHADRQRVRQRALPAPAGDRRREDRLRRAPSRTGPATGRRRHQTARDRRRRLCRDHRWGWHARVRQGRGARRRQRHAVLRHALTRAGTPNHLRHAAQRPDRNSDRPHHARRRRHRPCPTGRRNRRVAVAPGRRLGDPSGDRSDGRTGPQPGRQDPGSRRGRHRGRPLDRHGRRGRRAGVGADVGRAGERIGTARRGPARGRPHLQPRRGLVPVRRPHRGRRG